MTLFDKYGGVPMLTEVVKEFHARLIRRPYLRRYFSEITAEKIINHHVEYISFALGKPSVHFTNDELHEWHLPAGVTKASFQASTDLLIDVLEEADFSEEDLDQVRKRLNSVLDEIVTKGIEK